MILCDMCKNKIKGDSSFSLNIDDNNKEGDGYDFSIFYLDLCGDCASVLQEYLESFIDANRRDGMIRQIFEDKECILSFREQKDKSKQKEQQRKDSET